MRCSYVWTYAYFLVTCNGMEMRRARVSRRKIRLSPGKLLCALNSKGESSLASGRSYRRLTSSTSYPYLSDSPLIFIHVRWRPATRITKDLVRDSRPFSESFWVSERKMRNEWLRNLFATAIFALMVHGKFFFLNPSTYFEYLPFLTQLAQEVAVMVKRTI